MSPVFAALSAARRKLDSFINGSSACFVGAFAAARQAELATTATNRTPTRLRPMTKLPIFPARSRPSPRYKRVMIQAKNPTGPVPKRVGLKLVLRPGGRLARRHRAPVSDAEI